MATMKIFSGKAPAVGWHGGDKKLRLYESIGRLAGWLESNDYRAYDTFDGLSSKLLRPLVS
jgi:hypothetical protein